MPCYRGTSIEARAEGNDVITSDVVATRADYVEEKKEPEPVDYSRYKNRSKELEERK